jgi:hypothetical protein
MGVTAVGVWVGSFVACQSVGIADGASLCDGCAMGADDWGREVDGSFVMYVSDGNSVGRCVGRTVLEDEDDGPTSATYAAGGGDDDVVVSSSGTMSTLMNGPGIGASVFGNDDVYGLLAAVGTSVAGGDDDEEIIVPSTEAIASCSTSKNALETGPT